MTYLGLDSLASISEEGSLNCKKKKNIEIAETF